MRFFGEAEKIYEVFGEAEKSIGFGEAENIIKFSVVAGKNVLKLIMYFLFNFEIKFLVYKPNRLFYIIWF